MRVAWLLSLALLPLARAGEAVLGCGGFIKASRSIDFSRINVALYSRAGALKYETDCAPNNGYFFIPVYEKGEYVIKVAPPLGWKFSPSEVAIDINGVSDPEALYSSMKKIPSVGCIIFIFITNTVTLLPSRSWEDCSTRVPSVTLLFRHDGLHGLLCHAGPHRDVSLQESHQQR